MNSTLPLVLMLTTTVPAWAVGPAWTARDLKGMDLAQLDSLFAQGRTEALPCGSGRGKILMRTDGKRMRVALEGLIWKGKVFRENGWYVNQWFAFRAIGTWAVIESSWSDGQPCVVLDHPPKTPVFGNARDELRQIAPGLWLGRFYEKCPCGRLAGYFVLDFGCE